MRSDRPERLRLLALYVTYGEPQTIRKPLAYEKP